MIQKFTNNKCSQNSEGWEKQRNKEEIQENIKLVRVTRKSIYKKNIYRNIFINGLYVLCKTFWTFPWYYKTWLLWLYQWICGNKFENIHINITIIFYIKYFADIIFKQLNNCIITSLNVILTFSRIIFNLSLCFKWLY